MLPMQVSGAKGMFKALDSILIYFISINLKLSSAFVYILYKKADVFIYKSSIFFRVNKPFNQPPNAGSAHGLLHEAH
jgi:hypothetical protein